MRCLILKLLDVALVEFVAIRTGNFPDEIVGDVSWLRHGCESSTGLEISLVVDVDDRSGQCCGISFQPRFRKDAQG